MGHTGGDEYGVEVPARAVTDGFAYYLEAWDNSENGPGRSGAPELPHAIILEEPAPAVVSTGASVAVARPLDGDTVAASFNPVPAPHGASRMGTVPVPTPSAPRGPGAWTLTALLGGQRSHEQSYTDSVTLGRIGLDGTRRFGQGWFIAASADWRSYRQQYLPFRGAGTRVSVDENRFDLALTGGYDLGALSPGSGRLELIPVGGFQLLTARNDGFTFDILGPTAGLRASWTVAPFTARAIAACTYNLNKDSGGPNAFLSPVAAFAVRAGVQIHLTPAYAVELDYVGDAIEFEHVRRVGHGAVIGFSTSYQEGVTP
jgi:hypothetical protein